MLTPGKVVDAVEISKIQSEVRGLKVAKLNPERTAEVLVREKDASATRIFDLLTEKSELISQCDSFGANVKEL